jgi:hypothetical protein
MAAVANIVLADAQATPVNHTFVPIGPDTQGTWWFEDQSAASPVGYNRISMSIAKSGNPAPGANAGTRVSRVKMGIHTPKLETLGTSDSGIVPPATVAFVLRAQFEFILSDRSSLQDRKDLRKYAQGLLADAQFYSMVENLIGIY